MLPLSCLKGAAQEALDLILGVPEVREAEVFVSANGSLFARLNYTSHIPSNGVEEPRPVESFGIGVRAVFETPKG